MNISQIKSNARGLLKGNLWEALKPLLYSMGCTILLNYITELVLRNTLNIELFSYGTIDFSLNIVSLLLFPVNIGVTSYYLKFVRKEAHNLNDIFYFFKYFFPLLLIEIVMTILVSIGTLLFIIPGIILAFAFAMVYYIIADGNTNLKGSLFESMQMMKGYKLNYFLFHLSFIGWYLLGALTLGIAYIYVIPYVNVSSALYYEDLRKLNKPEKIQKKRTPASKSKN